MRAILFASLFAVLPAAAWAQIADSAASDDRFQIERQGDNVIRLDKKTGTISTCTPDGATLDCRASADERAALQAEIDRLAAEVESLKTVSSADGPETGISKDGKELTLKLPTEAEVRDAMTFLEDMFRRFVDAVRDFANGSA
jgi:hypothetical protein